MHLLFAETVGIIKPVIWYSLVHHVQLTLHFLNLVCLLSTLVSHISVRFSNVFFIRLSIWYIFSVNFQLTHTHVRD